MEISLSGTESGFVTTVTITDGYSVKIAGEILQNCRKEDAKEQYRIILKCRYGGERGRGELLEPKAQIILRCLIEHFGNVTDAVTTAKQCLSRQAG